MRLYLELTETVIDLYGVVIDKALQDKMDFRFLDGLLAQREDDLKSVMVAMMTDVLGGGLEFFNKLDLGIKGADALGRPVAVTQMVMSLQKAADH